jgi:hypothetical protein
MVLETKVAFYIQVFIGMFEQMIFQNMLDVIISADFATRFYEKYLLLQ